MIKRTKGEKAFNVFNYIILTLFAFTTLYPFLYTLTISISTPAEATRVGLHILPNLKALSLDAYRYVMRDSILWLSYRNTILRTLIGTVLALLVTCFYGYALSRPNLPCKKFFSSYLMFTMLFSAGQVPMFLNISSLGLLNSFWVYVLPMLISAYNVIVAKSFFASLPESLNESARIDGAGEFTIFFKIVVPLSKPIIMTLALWIGVGHWNAWLDSLLYITDQEKLVLQRYLQRLMGASANQLTTSAAVQESDMGIVGETIQSASIMVSIIPVLIAYPFVQKYFVKGVTLGAVKG